MHRIKDYLKKLGESKTLLHGVLFSGFSFVNRGFIFLLLLILANFISPAEYGYLSLFSTVIMILGFFICLSSEGYMSVSYFQEGGDSLKYTYSTILWTGVVMTAFFLSVLFVGGETLSEMLDLPRHILYIAVFVSLLTVLSNVNLDYFRLKERVAIYGIFSCGNALLNFIASILLVKTFRLGWEGRVYAQVGCTALFGLFSIVFFARKKCLTLHIKDRIKPTFAWSFPLIPMHATNFLRQGVDRYIINYFHSIADVGLFSFALNISNVITMVGFGFNQSISVDMYKILGDEELTPQQKQEKIRRMISKLLILFLLVALVLSLICYLLVPILLPQYAQSMNYFLVLSVYAFFVCHYLVFTNILFFYKKTQTIMYMSMSISILHLLLSFWFTQYSLYLTCIVYCITQGVFALGVQYYSYKELKKQLA